MKYLLFEMSAIESIINNTSLQSFDFNEGKRFVDILYGEYSPDSFESMHIEYDQKKEGLFFVGNRHERQFLLIDLCQCQLLEIENKTRSNVIIVLQKLFRTAIRIWDRQPFTSSERINGTKSIIFPFPYTDHRRIVVERSPSCERLIKRGIKQPLLAYKYNAEDAPHGEEVIQYKVLENAGETYLKRLPSIIQLFNVQTEQGKPEDEKSLQFANASELVSSGGFMYLPYEQQMKKLTAIQKAVVETDNITTPIRIDGPAGTGKTASMILRAYFLLQRAKREGRTFHIIFFSHNESTRKEAEYTFSLFQDAELFISKTVDQWIEFSTLLNYCISMINVSFSQVIERDASEAKQSQRLLIEECFDTIMSNTYKTYRALLSPQLRELLDDNKETKGTLLSMLQHEFSIQIKGRTDSTIEKYYELSAIPNALPVYSKKDKEFIFSIFREYQNMLQRTSVYDVDDITMQALSMLNAPIWRRERETKGFHYIFVDEMHLFNLNEQHTFHYLTNNLAQKTIPLCFAIDYNQAIGDRGDTDQDFITKNYTDVKNNRYQTVFRCSPQITDFCASIAAAGALMFGNGFHNPYTQTASNFTTIEERNCSNPCLYMYDSDEEMFSAVKAHIDDIQRILQCKNYEIAVVSFDDKLIAGNSDGTLQELFGRKVSVLQDRYSMITGRSVRDNNGIVVSNPYNINGLEFKAVILVGVDEGRVPQTTGTNDVSENYIKYIAFNQLYLTSSRAKYVLRILGNRLHGESSCLRYAIEKQTLDSK